MEKTISICIPVYNEASILPRTIDAVESLFANELRDYRLELVITDNSSTDDTWTLITDLSKSRAHLKAFRFSRNFGYYNSIFAAFSLATGDAVIELDADLEDPPEVIPKFVEQWEKGYEVVYGVRMKRYGNWWTKTLTAAFYRLLNAISQDELPVDSGVFRLLDRKVIDALVALPERNLYLPGLVAFLGFRRIPVHYERQARKLGATKFRFLERVVHAVDAITSFTKAPLRLIGVLGILLFISSMALGVHYYIVYVSGGVPVQGWTTLVLLLLGLHGITFIFLGILGEYLSRLFDDAKMRPRVIISESIHADDHPKSL